MSVRRANDRSEYAGQANHQSDSIDRSCVHGLDHLPFAQVHGQGGYTAGSIVADIDPADRSKRQSLP